MIMKRQAIYKNSKRKTQICATFQCHLKTTVLKVKNTN